MAYEEMDRIREEIEAWVRLMGKRRVEERLRITVHDLKESEVSSTIYS